MAANPRGFFENLQLRDLINKPFIEALGGDPEGIQPLPELEMLPPVEGLRQSALGLIAREGYDGARPWGFKDPRLSLLWPVWQEAFPQARWVIVRRDTDSIVRSYLRTGFTRQHSQSLAFWYSLAGSYLERLERLRTSVEAPIEVDADAVAHGDFATMEAAVRALGLVWTEAAARSFVDVRYWNRERYE